jgi:hypothetical protein
MACGRAFAEILHDGIGSIFDFRFQLKAGSEASVEGDAAASIPSFFSESRTKWPKLSSPTRLTQPTFRPRRQAGRDVQLRARDAFHKVLYRTSSPVSVATNIAMASPIVMTSSVLCMVYSSRNRLT